MRVDDIDVEAELAINLNEICLSYIGRQLWHDQVYDLRLDFSPHSCADLRIKVITTYMGDDTSFLVAEVL
jgi:hypothetical protein